MNKPAVAKLSCSRCLGVAGVLTERWVFLMVGGEPEPKIIITITFT